MIITTNKECYSTQRLIQSFEKRFKTQPLLINPRQTSSLQWDGLDATAPILIRSTGIDYDDSDLDLSQHYLPKKNLIQSIAEQRVFRDKLKQYYYFLTHGLPAIESHYLIGNQDIEAVVSKLEYDRFIVKTRRGMKGLGVIYIEGKKSLASLLQTQWATQDQRYLIQPYIEATEYRIFICNKQIISVLQKEKRGVTANAHTDTDVISIDQESFHSKAIEKLRSLLQSHYFAIDLLVDNKGQEYILECNLAPGFEQLEKITKLDIAEMIWAKS